MATTRQSSEAPKAEATQQPLRRSSTEKDPSEIEKHDAVHIEADSSDGFTGDITDEEEARRIRRKIDWRLLPLLVTLYTLAFLDRVNIGNARLWNLERDLGMEGNDYNVAVMVFYVPYIVFGIPANYILTRVKPRYWIGALTIGWGATVTAAGFCHNFSGLVVARIFIGIFEAGMFPGCMYLINTYYRRHELTTRMAWFMVANDIAGATSGLLGAGLGSLDGTGGYSGWSWIFFIEGAATIIMGVVAIFYVPPFPEQSTWLPEHEKQWLIRRLEADDGRKGKEMTFKGVLNALTDWKVLVPGICYLGVCVTAYSISVFTPTILSTFGWDNIKSNLLSSPIRVASAIVSVSSAIWSDKIKRRGVFIMSGYLISAMGNFIVMLVKVGNIRYMGLYFTAIGIYIAQPLIIGWGVNQVVGPNKRGTSTAYVSSMGQIGGIISALAFPKKDGPQYVPGISTNLAFIAAGLIGAIVMWGCLKWENKQRDLGKRDDRRDLPPEEVAKLGERHPDFRYTL